MMRRSRMTVALLYCFAASPCGAAEAANEFLSHVVGRIDRSGSSFACFSRLRAEGVPGACAGAARKIGSARLGNGVDAEAPFDRAKADLRLQV